MHGEATEMDSQLEAMPFRLSLMLDRAPALHFDECRVACFAEEFIF